MFIQNVLVTDAGLAIHPLPKWTAHYKWLQQEGWPRVAFGGVIRRHDYYFFPIADLVYGL